jgi:hypothetical protein
MSVALLERLGAFASAWSALSSPSDFASKTRFPVNISCRTRPSANTSERSEAPWPASCSGAMYCGVPDMSAAAVPCARAARPKSAMRACPRPSTITFAGFKSR